MKYENAFGISKTIYMPYELIDKFLHNELAWLAWGGESYNGINFQILLDYQIYLN